VPAIKFEMDTKNRVCNISWTVGTNFMFGCGIKFSDCVVVVAPKQTCALGKGYLFLPIVRT